MRSAYKILSLLLIISLAFACNKDDDDTGSCGDSQLENIEWEVLHFEENDAIITPPGTYLLQFTSEQYSIKLDVNECSGGYKACGNDKLLNLFGAGCTEICCDTGTAEFMLAFMADEVISYEIIGDRLSLLGPSTGDKKLVLVKR